MRFWISGPRVFGMRPGVSFGREDFRPSRALGSRPPSFIYVMQRGNDAVKIGISADPIARRATLQTGCPEPLRLVYVAAVQSNDATIVEQLAHRLLAMQRISVDLEWFNIAPEYAVAAIGAASFRTCDPIVPVPLDRVREIVAAATVDDRPARLPGWLTALRWLLLAVPVCLGLLLALLASLIWPAP